MSRQVDVKALVSHILRGDGSDRCRICMGDTSDGQVYLGDTVMIDGDKAVTLSELLETITGIEVQMDDDLPAGLCCTCFMAAMHAGHFRDQCRRANDQWVTTLNLLSTIPDHKQTKKLFVILTEDKIIFLDNLFEEKPKEVQIVRQDGNKCHSCQCPSCGKQFQYAQHLYQHLKESTDNLRACHVCAEILTRDLLVEHLKEVHNKNPYDCKKCPALLQTYEQYELHLVKAHTPGACTCGDCGRSFQSNHGYHAHLSVHAPKTCPGCNKLFRNQTCYMHHVKICCNLDRKHLDTHQTKHKVTVLVENRSNNKKIKVGMRGSAHKECICDYCKKKFAGRKFVAAHIQIVHMKNTHKPCAYCGKLLAAAHMTEHLKKHESNESYTCEMCGIVLKTRLGYKQHVRLHTGERPYPCQYCGQTFSASSRRSEHVRKTHNNTEIVLKHACELCPARFRLPYRLKKHMVSVHGDGSEPGPQFVCTVCQEKFSSCRGLLHHSRKHQSAVMPRKIHKKIKLDDLNKVQDDAFCPPGVCVSCASTALAAQEFRIFVRNAQKMWYTAVSSLAVLSTASGPNVKTVYAFVRESDLSVQTVQDYTGKEPKVVLNRLRNRLTKKTNSNKKPRNTRSGPTCCCPDCGKTFTNPYALNMHLKNSGRKDSCLYCGAVVMRGNEIVDHLSIVHGEKVVLCSQCPLYFPSELKAKAHQKTAHKAGVMTCCDCGRTFGRSSSFDLHSQMHAVRICRACGLQFTNRSCYREHRSQCEPEAKPDVNSLPKNRRSNIRDPAQYTCDYCGKTYNSRPQLKNHIIWIHMDVRPHECKTCKKRFFTYARLVEHSVVHTRVRNFECDICGAKLVTKMAAVYHRRRHTGEKPYKCNDCGETFISSSRRSDHAKRRHNAKRLQCTLCTFTFVRRHDLRKHMNKVHSNQSEALSPMPETNKAEY